MYDEFSPAGFSRISFLPMYRVLALMPEYERLRVPLDQPNTSLCHNAYMKYMLEPTNPESPMASETNTGNYRLLHTLNA